MKWIEIQKKILKLNPEIQIKHRHKFRQSLINILNDRSFQFLLKFCVFMNVICLAIDFNEAPIAYSDFLRYSGIFFTIVYNLESVFKILAFGPRTYFLNSSYLFEFFLAICYILDTISENFYFQNQYFDPETESLIRMSRIFRLMPILRLLQYLKGVYKIFRTLCMAFSLLINLFLLLLLIFFIYAIIGCFFFKQVTNGITISGDVNFDNIFSALMILIKCTTADDWGFLIFDTSNTDIGCEQQQTCGSKWAYLYFVSFVIISNFILLNMFILAIIQQFEIYHKNPSNPMLLINSHIEAFRKAWVEYCTIKKEKKLKIEHLMFFLKLLGTPLGLDQKSEFFISARKFFKMSLIT